jgi:hypothetical protein
MINYGRLRVAFCGGLCIQKVHWRFNKFSTRLDSNVMSAAKCMSFGSKHEKLGESAQLIRIILACFD